MRIGNVFTNESKTHVIRSSVNIEKANCQSLTPVTHNNRFWPLIDMDDDNEGKVVMHESKGGDKMFKNNDRKQKFLSTSSHSEANVSCNLHNDMVGGDGTRFDTVTIMSHGGVSSHSPAPTVAHDKYDLALRFKNKHKEKIEKAGNVAIFKQWDSQTVGKFGYIPLAPQVTSIDDKCNKVQSDLLQIHDKVKRMGTYNFLEAKIQIKSQLNVEALKAYLVGYWDKQLIQLIQYGFPLSFDKNTELISSNINHSSATNCPEDIAVYLKEERTFGAILGPFTKPPVPNLHVSPFLTREKPGANSRRVIVDLSYPQGASVNAGVDPESYLGFEFLLTLPSIDYITNKVVQLGKGSLIYKIDISRAFRHIKIDPADYNLLGLNFKAYYLDTCLPFGFRHGSGMFQHLSDSIRYIMLKKGHHVTNYIDDIIGQATKSQAEASFHTLYDLLGELGLDISKKKLLPPSTKASYLGVVIDTEEFTISVPENKLIEIKQLCDLWCTKRVCNKRDLQSLLGRLLYITKCVKASRPFLNRMLEILRQTDKQSKINLDEAFLRDLKWFQKFLTTFNGVAFFSHNPVHCHIELDASLQGLGAICDNEVYSIPIPLGVGGYQIVHLEMLNILVALKVWGHKWTKKKNHDTL